MIFLRNILGCILTITLVLYQPFLIEARHSAESPTAAGPAEKSTNVTDVSLEDIPSPRPFYAIAHRVLMDYGVRDALRHGANALEIDMMAWTSGWYADHDGTLFSKGDTAEKMFKTIAGERRAGKDVVFVWLDLKNPDYKNGANPRANIESLRSLARQILQPVGVKVLYGFYDTQLAGRSYKIIRDELNANEALAVEGNTRFVRRIFEFGGPFDIRKRALTKGLFMPWLNFGSCRSNGTGICPELRKAVDSQAFGKVFGWTITRRDAREAVQMMSDAHVDGLIYGFAVTHYYDHADTRMALSILTDWLKKNKDDRYLATNSDQPW